MKKIIFALALVIPFGLAHAEGTHKSTTGVNDGTSGMSQENMNRNSATSPTNTNSNWDANSNTQAQRTNLSSNQISDAQTALSDRGYDLSVDGVVGPETRTAIKRFQAENGIPQSGELDTATLNALNITTDEMDSDRVPASTPTEY